MDCKECLVSVVMLMLLICGVDVSCGPEVSPWIAYVIPIALASRYCGFAVGAMYAVLAGLLLCVAARHSGHPFSADGYFFIAAAWQALALLLIAWLVSRLATLQLTVRRVILDRR